MPAYYPAFVLAILLLELLVVALIWLWWRTLKSQQESLQHASTQTYEELNQIIAQTTAEAQRVMTEALKSANKLNDATQSNIQHITDNTRSLIEAQNQWQQTNLEKLLTDYQLTFQDESKKSLAAFHEKVGEQLTTIGQVIAGEMKQTSTMIQQDLRQQLKDVDKEIETYKQDQIKTISAQGQTVVKQIVKDMIGRDFTPDDHHDLVKNQLTHVLGSLPNAQNAK